MHTLSYREHFREHTLLNKHLSQLYTYHCDASVHKNYVFYIFLLNTSKKFLGLTSYNVFNKIALFLCVLECD